MATAAPTLSKPEVKRLLAERRERWLSGDLRYLLRGFGKPSPPGKAWPQIQMYDWTHSWKAANPDRRGPLIIWCRRRAGKSTFRLICHLENMIREPDRHQHYIAPYGHQCDEIARPIIEWALRDAPVDLLYRWRRNTLFVQNPRWKAKKAWNRLMLLGSDSNKGDKMRGLPSASEVTLDEARDMENFDYLMESLMPHVFTGQKDPLLCIITTPPPNLECSLVKRYHAKAINDGRVLQIRGSADASFSEKEAQDILEMADISPSSAAYQREVEAELVPDLSVAVVPEWHDLKDLCIVNGQRPYFRPKFFIPQVEIDAAYSCDKLAILWGYIDQENHLIVVERSFVGDRMNTRDLLTVALRTEKELWPELAGTARVRRRMDGPGQQIDDLYRDSGLRRDFGLPHGYYVTPIDRAYDRMSALQKLRSNIGRVRIHDPGAKDLIYQLNFGTVKYSKDHKKIDFVRTSELGHLDAVAALRNLVHYARLNFPLNAPIPPNPRDPQTQIEAGYRFPRINVGQVTFDQGLVMHNNRGLYENGRAVS